MVQATASQPRWLHSIITHTAKAGRVPVRITSTSWSGNAAGAMNMPMIPPTVAATTPPTPPSRMGAMAENMVCSGTYPPPPT